MTAKITIADLEWSEPAQPNGKCHYDHVIAETAFGEVWITWKGWKSSPSYIAYLPWDGDVFECTLEEAKEAVRTDLENRIHAALRAEDAPEPEAPTWGWFNEDIGIIYGPDGTLWDVRTGRNMSEALRAMEEEKQALKEEQP